MRIVKYLLVFLLGVSFDVSAQSIISPEMRLYESLNIKAKKLELLYTHASSSEDADNIYKREFFEAFPATFNQLDALYGDNLDRNHKPAPLNGQAEQHIIDLFNRLDNIVNDTLYYRKIISIAVGGHWDGDAVNFFQHGLRQKVLKNPALVVYILKNMNNDNIYSFWYFYFDGPVPNKQISKPLKRIKTINQRIYSLMTKAHNKVLKFWGN